MNYRNAISRVSLIAWRTIAAILFMYSIVLNNAQAQFLFETRIDYDAGDFPRSVAIGDLNVDGYPDLAVANDFSNNVSVLLGNGDGSFQNAGNYAAGAGPRSVAIGDLNVDGYPDLAVANGGSDNVSVLLGNGDGSFQSPANYAAGPNPTSIAIGDLNVDDYPDLAVTNGLDPIGFVSVLLGNGDGSFQSPVAYDVDGGYIPVSLAIGDLNADDYPDLAVANYGGGVAVLLGNGDGSFQSAVSYRAGERPRSVAIGDLDVDGYPDLAVANDFSNNVSVLLGNGDGSFQSELGYVDGFAAGYGVGNSPRSAAIGDLDVDGYPDLAVANAASDNVSVLINTVQAVGDSDGGSGDGGSSGSDFG
jgi:hypothetical protein